MVKEQNKKRDQFVNKMGKDKQRTEKTGRDVMSMARREKRLDE